jgi:fructose-bisphosphate aldolase class I
MGAHFARWRAAIAITAALPSAAGTAALPSAAGTAANAQALARCATLCQEAGAEPTVEPTVEPDVLMTGGHGLLRCADVGAQFLHTVFAQPHVQGVLVKGMLPKSNRVLPALACAHQHTGGRGG